MNTKTRPSHYVVKINNGSRYATILAFATLREARAEAARHCEAATVHRGYGGRGEDSSYSPEAI